MKREGDRITNAIKCLCEDIRRLGQNPITNYADDYTGPVEPMGIRVGEWADAPFPGVRNFGVKVSEDEIVVIAESEGAVRLPPHTHGGWDEQVVISHGEIYEHTNGRVYKAGGEVYYKPEGRIHEPEFMKPTRCMITWRRKSPQNPKPKQEND